MQTTAFNIGESRNASIADCIANPVLPEAGAPPTRGETQLHRAAAYAPTGTVKMLLDAVADRSAV